MGSEVKLPSYYTKSFIYSKKTKIIIEYIRNDHSLMTSLQTFGRLTNVELRTVIKYVVRK